MARVSFIGLGVMGAPMAGHLAAAGHDVTVFNRSPDKAEAWAARHQGRTAPSPHPTRHGGIATRVVRALVVALPQRHTRRTLLSVDDGQHMHPQRLASR